MELRGYHETIQFFEQLGPTDYLCEHRMVDSLKVVRRLLWGDKRNLRGAIDYYRLQAEMADRYADEQREDS